MVSEKMKNALAVANGFDEDRKTELIRERVRKQFPHPDDEIAMLRKAVTYLFDLIATLHEGELDNAEFAEYHALVEQIKADVKNEIASAGSNTETA